MKLKGIILSLASVAVVAVTSIMLFIYWPAITGTINKNQYLTPEQGQEMYNKGYTDGNKSEEEQLAQIDYYKSLVSEYELQSSVYSNEINSLNGTVATSNQTIQELTAQKSNLELQVTNLQTIKAQNENTIQGLNSQIVSLQAQANQVPELNTQIANLQALVTQLQATNQINADTVTSLNAQIVSLNNQIRDLSSLSQNASDQITALTNRCNELQASINYYESFISTQENSSQAVATYEVDGAVWKIEIVNKGEITLPQFTNTDTLIFNGWTVNDTLLGNTYTINANTKFVASVVHKHAVQFMTDDVVYNSQYVVENEYATVPTAPTKTGYDFLGWSLNGVDIVSDINITAVTENVTYHAVFVKVHTVTFMNGDQVVATQSVRNGEYANANNVTVETDGTFIGWQINDSAVEVNNYQILADTIFVAQINFDDWYKVKIQGFNNSKWMYASDFWSDGEHTYYSANDLQYELILVDSKTLLFSPVSWNGLSGLIGSRVWSDGINVFYGFSHRLEKETRTWVPVSWTGDCALPTMNYTFCKLGEYLCVVVNDNNGYGYKTLVLNTENYTYVEPAWENEPKNKYRIPFELAGKYYLQYQNGDWRNVVVLDENTNKWVAADCKIVTLYNSSDRAEKFWFDGVVWRYRDCYFDVEGNKWVRDSYSYSFEGINNSIYYVGGDNVFRIGGQIYTILNPSSSDKQVYALRKQVA